jgi:microcin C transport system permease protein
MLNYILRRLLLVIPTLFGIMLINFLIVQTAPGGPIDQIIARLQGEASDVTSRFTGGSGQELVGNTSEGGGNSVLQDSDAANRYANARGLDPKYLAELEKQFGFDKPLLERFFLMMGQYLTFDFGTSYFKGRKVVDLVLEKMPVSISLGIWSTLITYLVCIPLGIRKAVQDGSRFDLTTSTILTLTYAIPSFLFAILLIVLFAGGRYFAWFPLRGLTSEGFSLLPWYRQIIDYLWHITLPILAMIIDGFAYLTFLTKNAFIDELSKHYVLTARAKGLNEQRVLYGHVFRNAMLLVIAGFPGAFISMLFTGALLIEVIFSLDGLGLLGFEAALSRDYPVMFATLYFFTLLGLLLKIVSDITYSLVDPRIDFARRG